MGDTYPNSPHVMLPPPPPGAAADPENSKDRELWKTMVANVLGEYGTYGGRETVVAVVSLLMKTEEVNEEKRRHRNCIVSKFNLNNIYIYKDGHSRSCCYCIDDSCDTGSH